MKKFVALLVAITLTTVIAAPVLQDLLPSNANHKFVAAAAETQRLEYVKEFADNGFDIECAAPKLYFVYGNFSLALSTVFDKGEADTLDPLRAARTTWGFDIIFSRELVTGSDEDYTIAGVAQLPSLSVQNAVWFFDCSIVGEKQK